MLEPTNSRRSIRNIIPYFQVMVVAFKSPTQRILGNLRLGERALIQHSNNMDISYI
jgi:hypothetical protein